MRCPSCGATAAPAARFCDQCGGRLPGAEPRLATAAGDRRIVSALFADLVDYVRMVAEHDAEDVKQRVDAALGAMVDAVRRFDGTVEKFIGDAIFAVFGYPRAHDDDALRAALCAIAIREGLRALGPWADGEHLQVRIGVATGEVVAARRPDDGSSGASLTGPAVVTAARIQDIAQPGEILLDAATVSAIRRRVELEDRGPVVLRGHPAAVRVHALVGAPRALRSWDPPRGRLIGRTAERAQLRAAIEATVKSGRGRTIIVAGEAGAGKSRLVADLETDALAAGLRWTWTENVSYESGEPYRFVRAFAQAVADEEGLDSGALARRLLFTPDRDPAASARMTGAIAAVARDAAFSGWEADIPSAPTDPVEVAGGIGETVEAYIRALAALRGPRVAVVEDLHWLDRSSEVAVGALVRLSGEVPFVVVLTARPGSLPDWASMPHVTRIDLAGLDAGETEVLAADVAGGELLRHDALRIHERTAGNPLFVGETIRAALADGSLAIRDGRFALLDRRRSDVPLTLRALLGARIDALTEDAREVLGVASVIGITFSTAIVDELVDGHASRPILLGLAEAALVVPLEPSDSWRFSHALIHDAAYVGLLASRRRALHARLATYLESAEPVAPLGVIGGHWAAAARPDRAIPALVAAAEQALAVGATAEAAGFWLAAAEATAEVEEKTEYRRRSAAAERGS